jgi:hypothetical protein
MQALLCDRNPRSENAREHTGPTDSDRYHFHALWTWLGSRDDNHIFRETPRIRFLPLLGIINPRLEIDPVDRKITLPEVIEGFADYYRQPGNAAWGSLHCVLDDGNIRDRDVQACIDHAVEKGDAEGERLARILLTLTKAQRLRLPSKVS